MEWNGMEWNGMEWTNGKISYITSRLHRWQKSIVQVVVAAVVAVAAGLEAMVVPPGRNMPKD